MINNQRFAYLESLKDLRAEVPSEYSPNTELKYKYINKQDQFKSIDELNTYLNKLNDEEFDIFTEQMIKILQEEQKDA